MVIRYSHLADAVSRLVAVATLTCFACAGPDRLLDPVLSQGGSYFAALGGGVGDVNSGARASTAGGSSSRNLALGGSANVSDTSDLGVEAPEFDWLDVTYEANGGKDVDYQQGHYPGLPCFATCHEHTITLAGTIYRADGTSSASNVQVGILVGGNLSTTYSGSAGNFYLTVSDEIDWATAQLAVRTEQGSRNMRINSQASGNCNGCHKSGNRIVVP